MHPFQFMTDDQLIAGLNDFAERAEAGEVDDTEIESVITFVDNKARNMQRLIKTGADIRERGVCQADLARLEEISPGVTAGLNSGDYTFLASQHGLEPALNAIDWKAVGKWGIIGAIIAAIIALIAKIMGRSKGAKPAGEQFSDNYRSTRKEHDDRMRAIREKQRKEDEEWEREYEERRKKRENDEKNQSTQKPKSGSVDIDLDSYYTRESRENDKKHELKKGIEASNYEKIIKLNHTRLNSVCVTKPTVADYLKLPLSDILSKDKDISDDGLAAIYSFCYVNALHENQQAQISSFILRMTDPKSSKETLDAVETDRKFMGFLSTYQKRLVDLYEELIRSGTDDSVKYDEGHSEKIKEKTYALLKEYETTKKALGLMMGSSPSISGGIEVSADGSYTASSMVRTVTMQYASKDLDYAWEDYKEAIKGFKDTINNSSFDRSNTIIATISVFLEDVEKVSKEVESEIKVLKRQSEKLDDVLNRRKKTHLEAKEAVEKSKRNQISTDEEEMKRDHERTSALSSVAIEASEKHSLSFISKNLTGLVEAQLLSVSRVLMAMSKGGSTIIASAESGKLAHNMITSKVNDMLRVLVSIR